MNSLISKILLLIVLLCSIPSFSQEEKIEYEQVGISVYLDNYWTFEVESIVSSDERLFVNIKELFDNIGLKCLVSSDGNRLEGFVEIESKRYEIDIPNREVKIGNKIYNIIIIEKNGDFYYDYTDFEEMFGLKITFSPRALSIKITSKFELPYIKKIRLDRIHQNLSKVTQDGRDSDIVIGRKYNFFKFGNLDWSFNTQQSIKNKPLQNILMSIGSEFLFGEANISLNYNSQFPISNRQIQYNWRWIDNNNSIVRQISVGRVSTQSYSFLSSPVIGTTISNSPNSVRNAKGFYNINDYTEPNWVVELYINDVLINFTTADISGYYSFRVPNVYGISTVKLKFYGQLGEERTEERIMNIPSTFTPENVLEYSIFTGVNEENKIFSQSVFNYGLRSNLTITGGLEYFSLIDNPYIPFSRISYQPFSRLGINLEYVHNFKIRSNFNYNITNSSFLEIDYSKFDESQKITPFSAIEETRIRLFHSYRWNETQGIFRTNYSRLTYNTFTFNQFDFIISKYYKNITINTFTLINWINDREKFINTNLSLGLRLRNNYTIRTLVEHNFTNSSVIRYNLELERRVGKVFLSSSYQRNVSSKNNNVTLNFRYDMPFTRLNSTVLYNNNNLALSNTMQGSVGFGGVSDFGLFEDNFSVGKGGIVIYPFLDINNNGKRDSNEPLVKINNVKITGGRAIIDENKSIIRISNLSSFVNYDLEFFDTDLENIEWKFKYKTYKVLIDPNQYKKIYVPIVVMGEISGYVNINTEDSIKGQDRIILHILNMNGDKITQVLSEEDGYYSYLGLEPGRYIIKVDEDQINNLKLGVGTNIQNFEVRETEQGDVLRIDFMLNKKN